MRFIAYCRVGWATRTQPGLARNHFLAGSLKLKWSVRGILLEVVVATFLGCNRSIWIRVWVKALRRMIRCRSTMSVHRCFAWTYCPCWQNVTRNRINSSLGCWSCPRICSFSVTRWLTNTYVFFLLKSLLTDCKGCSHNNQACMTVLKIVCLWTLVLLLLQGVRYFVRVNLMAALG